MDCPVCFSFLQYFDLSCTTLVRKVAPLPVPATLSLRCDALSDAFVFIIYILALDNSLANSYIFVNP